VADGDVPGTGTGGNTAGGDGDEAAWLDLVARLEAPEPAADEETPWPDREDLAGPVRVTPPSPPSPPTPTLPDALPWEPPTGSSGFPGMPGMPGMSIVPPPLSPLPDQPWPRLGGTGPRDAPIPENPADEHYRPPEPPPLPRIDPVTKGAWLALFGGPLYLLVSYAVGQAVSGFAAFLAVAAFVGGFIVLVLRMDNGRPPDSGSDDGAVV
jgi:hypothetical protein